ncbi:MAG: AMP-binding protein, partial [Sneathiella sp.]|nr:AMP-binding protein [Sneathiella sp.]
MLFNDYQSIGRLSTTDQPNWVSSEELRKAIKVREKDFSRTIVPGDKIMICHGGSSEFVVDLLAVWSCGAAAACVNPLATQNEIDNLISFIEPNAIIRNVDGPLVTLKERHEKAVPSFHMDMPALYLFTSGTTGTPKGVEHNFRSLLARFTLNQVYMGRG